MSAARAGRVAPCLVLLVLALVAVGVPRTAANAGPPMGPVAWGSGGVGAVVPPPGEWVSATFDLAGGGALSVVVETGLDGRIQTRSPALGGTRAASTLASEACSDAAYSFSGGRWHQPFNWFYNPRLAPPLLSLTDGEAAMREGTRNVTAATNDCGRADAVGATASYLGRAVHDPHIVGTLCLGADGINVVGWGPLPRPILAGTCNYGVGSQLVESDVIVSNLVLWYRSRPALCRGQYDLSAVMTHERGHTFGLGHVSEAEHPHLTMSEGIAECDGSASTLGLGDLLALEALY